MTRDLGVKRADSQTMIALAAIQGICGTVFGVDILYETHVEWREGGHVPTIEIVHLVVELLAVCLLYCGFYIANKAFVNLRKAEQDQAKLLGSLRGQFDTIIMAQFEKWHLSKSESDIALLSLRGLKISEIAAMRETKSGTIKGQLHSVFRKSGFHTRTELLGYFMDDLLDFAAGAHNKSYVTTTKASAAI